jgi:GntR family transcriptional regulator/MocR family aminotransferase
LQWFGCKVHFDVAREDQFAAPELLVTLDRASATPLRAQVERELREAVRAGRLHAGTALPSTRALAGELGVSRGVVVEAYAQLAAEGYLTARQGAPTRVASVAAVAVHARSEEAAAAPSPPAARNDLRPSVPDLSAFPRRAWLAAERRALASLPHAALDYPELGGAPPLRRALAVYLGRARGVVATADALVVTTGTLQSIALLADVLLARGVDRVAVEEPGFHLHRLLLRRRGLTTVRVPVDGDGLDVERLERVQAGAVLATPAHQMPLGGVLSPARRSALLDWAERRDALVIEDDYDGEYRYDRGSVGALQGLAPERVAYLGSASKALAPSVRLGWAVLPSWLVAAVAEEKWWADSGSPLLGQLASYRRRRDVLLAGIARLFPGMRVLGVAAGLHVALEPPRPFDEEALVARAAERGVAMFAFRNRATGASILLLGYANVPEPSIEPALRELRAAYEAAAS